MKRRYLILLLIFLVLLVLPAASLWTLGHSEAALQRLVGMIPERFGALEKLSIRDVRGSLADGFEIGTIEVEHDLTRVEARNLRARIELLPLLWQSVRVTEFSLDTLVIEQRTREQPPRSGLRPSCRAC